MEIYFIKQGY